MRGVEEQSDEALRIPQRLASLVASLVTNAVLMPTKIQPPLRLATLAVAAGHSSRSVMHGEVELDDRTKPPTTTVNPSSEGDLEMGLNKSSPKKERGKRFSGQVLFPGEQTNQVNPLHADDEKVEELVPKVRWCEDRN